MPSERTEPSKVVCFGKGIKFGYLDIPLDVTIDTKEAGPGK